MAVKEGGHLCNGRLVRESMSFFEGHGSLIQACHYENKPAFLYHRI